MVLLRAEHHVRPREQAVCTCFVKDSLIYEYTVLILGEALTWGFGVRAGSQDHLGVLCYRVGNPRHHVYVSNSQPNFCNSSMASFISPTNLPRKSIPQYATFEHVSSTERFSIWTRDSRSTPKTECVIFLTCPAC